LPSVSECRADLLNGEEDSLGVDSIHQLQLDREVFVDDPVEAFDVAGVTYRLYRHPHLFITPSVRMWLEEYDYSGNNYSMVPYLDRHPCWLECKNKFEFYLEAMSGR